MAKKFGKFLLFTAAVGAAGAAAYYYMQKKDAELLNGADEDYDDFSEDAEDAVSRTYVPLNHEEAPLPETDASAATPEMNASAAAAPESVSFKEDSPKADFTPLTEKVADTVENVKDEVKETVESFFDEDSAEDEESSEEFFDDEDADK